MGRFTFRICLSKHSSCGIDNGDDDDDDTAGGGLLLMLLPQVVVSLPAIILVPDARRLSPGILLGSGHSGISGTAATTVVSDVVESWREALSLCLLFI